MAQPKYSNETISYSANMIIIAFGALQISYDLIGLKVITLFRKIAFFQFSVEIFQKLMPLCKR